jgi:hypothetical protein
LESSREECRRKLIISVIINNGEMKEKERTDKDKSNKQMLKKELYRVIINDCSRSRRCPCYEIFAAFM